MINNLEKTFFDTFGIEPKLTFYDLVRLKEAINQEIGGRCSANWQGETKEETIRRFSPRGWKVLECKDVYIYPQITDSILLELICILSEWRTYLHSSYTIKANNSLNLKQDVLKDFLELFKWYEFKKHGKDIKQQVRTLFEEVENE